NASVRRIARELHGIDGMESTIRQAGTRCTAIEQGLINFNALFVFGGRTVEDSWSTSALQKPIASVCRRGRERPIVRQIIERSMSFRRTPGNDVRQSWK